MALVTSAAAGLRAVDLGATILQLRAQFLTARELEIEARRLVEGAAVPLIISSRCDVALATGAAGVNLPERDVSVAEARRLIGAGMVGRSVHSVEAAREAARDGPDFLIFGPVWPSATHPEQPARGLHALVAVIAAVRAPVLAIGGVNTERARVCLAAGAAGYAAIRMFE